MKIQGGWKPPTELCILPIHNFLTDIKTDINWPHLETKGVNKHERMELAQKEPKSYTG